jgi:membrane-associated protease RseP (regulator of RpoE activity)
MDKQMIILFLLSLILIIILHEAAHLIVAKCVGCKVEVFSIGFGKPILFKKELWGTMFQITPWVFGGYCQLKDELSISESLDAFTNLKYWKKVAIALAGVLANIKIGLTCLFLGIYFNHYIIFYFGYLNLVLGLGNLLPIPALDGSYPILMLLEKFMKKEKATKTINLIMRTFFIILMLSNILLLPWFFTKGFKNLQEQSETIYYNFGGK